ncbi:MAG: tetratricopeptide repeat protein [Bdellovibrionales bacterium]|nr:tetratricopeptide repeat protein [Bdellovibrionales bacterium]
MDLEKINANIEPVKTPQEEKDFLISKKTAPLEELLKKETPVQKTVSPETPQNQFQSIEEKAKDLFDKNLYSQTVALLKTLHAKGLGSADSYALLGASYHQQNEFKKAVTAYKRALELDPSHLECLTNLSLLRLDLGDYERGKLVYKRAYQAYFEHTQSKWEKYIAEQHIQSGQAYFNKGYFHEALLEFLKASPKQEHLLSLDLSIIKCLWKLDRKGEAIHQLLQTKRNHPLSIEVSLLLGEFYFQSRKIPQAILEWERVLYMDPKNKKALKFLAHTQNIQSVQEGDLA